MTLHKSANQVIIDRMNSWLDNPPDYYDVTDVFDRLGALKKKARLLKAEITMRENRITLQSAKPKGNDAIREKIEATQDLVFDLNLIEADIDELEIKAKRLEYMKTMFNSSSYAVKLRSELL